MKDTTKLREFIMSTVREGGGIESLAAKVLELQTPDKLRIAADLLLLNKVDVAEAIATRAVQEMQLVMLFAKKGQR